MTAEVHNCEATILHNSFPHKLHEVFRNDGWSPTGLLIMHMLSICCKLSAPPMRHLHAHYIRPIDLAQLMLDMDWRYALCILRLHRKPHFIVGGGWNKSLHHGTAAAMSADSMRFALFSGVSCYALCIQNFITTAIHSRRELE